jgi:hypothetical protein
MATKQDKRPRASNGRFVKKRSSAPKSSGSSAAVSSDHAEKARSDTPPAREGHEGAVPLAILTLAIVTAVLGFAVHFLWVGALVLMGVLWGVMVAGRQQRQGTVKGLAAEIVTTVVDEAKGVMDATSGTDAEGTPTSSGPTDRTA